MPEDEDLSLAGPTGMAFMLTWLRLSTNRQLDWYRNSSHQSKDIAHVQKTLAQRMADKVSTNASCSVISLPAKHHQTASCWCCLEMWIHEPAFVQRLNHTAYHLT